MKPEILATKLRPVLPLLCCPLCAAAFALPAQSLVCANGHCFDIASRGYTNLAPSRSQAAEKYDARLFESRSAIFEGGFYAPVLCAVTELLEARFGKQPFSLLDAGCGEGYYAKGIAKAMPQATVLGVDLSREAIIAAARADESAHWFVADVKHLPVRDASVSAVLDVLTPADYTEFDRVLQPDGLLIKVVPGADYLIEIRRAVAGLLRSGDTYDNTPVLEHLQRHATIEQKLVIRREYPLTAEQSHHFLRMTPMTFSIPDEALAGIVLSSVTLELDVLCCTMHP